MKKRIITQQVLCGFAGHLHLEERSPATIERYLREAQRLRGYLHGTAVHKENVAAYKAMLLERLSPASVNTALAAINRLLGYMGALDCRVKRLRCQRPAFCDRRRELTREEYIRLVRTARRMGNERLSLTMQAICSTGVRVSEVRYLTVEAARAGQATVSLKGKTRTILLPRELCRRLLGYARRQGVTSGPVLRTRRGTPLGRKLIWAQMKKLCAAAGVEPEKVFPHNLRHLFARQFYQAERDIAKLADVLGHSSIETTRIYLVTAGEEHRKRLETLHLLC